MDGVRQLDGGVVEYLATKRQLWALSALMGATFVIIAPIFFIPALLATPVPWVGIGYNAVLVVVFGTLLSLFAPRLMGRNGIAADHLGIRRNRGLVSRYVSWDKIVDIRTERTFGRDRAAVYLASGHIWRLPTPYDGRLLAHDPAFAAKVEMLRGEWTTRRAAAARGAGTA